LNRIQTQLCQVFDLPEDSELNEIRHQLNQRYAGLEKYTIDGQGLKAFIVRLQNNKDSDQAWLESVAAFLGSAPPDKWKEKNVAQAEYRLVELAGRLKELALVHAEQLKADKGSQATLVRMVSEHGECSQVVYLTDELKKQANAKIAELKLNDVDKALKQAMLIQLMNAL